MTQVESEEVDSKAMIKYGTTWGHQMSVKLSDSFMKSISQVWLRPSKTILRNSQLKGKSHLKVI